MLLRIVAGLPNLGWVSADGLGESTKKAVKQIKPDLRLYL